MGDGRILLKPRRDDSFRKAYRMSLISAGSISLDSTFKHHLSKLNSHWCTVQNLFRSMLNNCLIPPGTATQCISKCTVDEITTSFSERCQEKNPFLFSLHISFLSRRSLRGRSCKYFFFNLTNCEYFRKISITGPHQRSQPPPPPSWQKRILCEGRIL
jgi:hypothetical protein